MLIETDADQQTDPECADSDLVGSAKSSISNTVIIAVVVSVVGAAIIAGAVSF